MPTHTYMCTRVTRTHTQPLPEGTRTLCSATGLSGPVQGVSRHGGGTGSPSSSGKRKLPLLRTPTALRGARTLRNGLSCGPPGPMCSPMEPGAADIHHVVMWHLAPALCPQHQLSLSSWVMAVTSGSITFL